MLTHEPEYLEPEYLEPEVNAEQILLEWKEQYGYIYVAEMDETIFVYRLLSYQEYQDLQQRVEDHLHLDELVCQACVLDPYIEDWSDDIYAGYTSALSSTILEQSLLIASPDQHLDVQEMIAQKEMEMDQSFLLQLPLIIKHCFPEYTLAEAESIPLPRQIELYAKAKWMLKNLEHIDLQFSKEED